MYMQLTNNVHDHPPQQPQNNKITEVKEEDNIIYLVKWKHK